MDRPMEARLCRQHIAQGLARLGHRARGVQGRESMVRVSLYEYRRRCGDPGCRCGRGEWHQGRALSVSAVGHSQTISRAGLDGAKVEREVEYRRPYGVFDRCGISYAPLDCGLGIPTTGGTVRRTERVCHAAVTGRSFETAAEILREHDGIALSANQVRIISEAEGQRVTQERQAEVEAFQKRERSFAGTEAPALIVVTADGGRVQTRQPEEGSAWKEDKVGGVYDAIPQKDPAAATAEKYEGAKARQKTYVASMAGWEEFGWMLCVEAMRRGKESARLGPPAPKEASSSPRVILHRNRGYFADNRDGLDYPRFRIEGWPIGSGIAEGAVKQFAMRLKGTEKFWNGFGCGLGAEEMVALCALHRSEDGRWRAYWERRSLPYVKTRS